MKLIWTMGSGTWLDEALGWRAGEMVRWSTPEQVLADLYRPVVHEAVSRARCQWCGGMSDDDRCEGCGGPR